MAKENEEMTSGASKNAEKLKAEADRFERMEKLQ